LHDGEVNKAMGADGGPHATDGHNEPLLDSTATQQEQLQQQCVALAVFTLGWLRSDNYIFRLGYGQNGDKSKRRHDSD